MPNVVVCISYCIEGRAVLAIHKIQEGMVEIIIMPEFTILETKLHFETV